MKHRITENHHFIRKIRLVAVTVLPALAVESRVQVRRRAERNDGGGDHDDAGTRCDIASHRGTDDEPQDTNAHGTHVAGIAAAATGNGIGIAGTAPDSKIMPVRVIGTDATGTDEGIAEGINWGVANGADVVTLSLGETGVLSRVSKGGPLNATITGAAAPGVQILSTAPTEPTSLWSPGSRGYELFDGTSMATPIVSGIAAMLLSTGGRASTVIERIVTTADAASNPQSGAGVVDPSETVG
ncbi:MAG: peptidase S8 [Actinobacteria bacterium]|nr:peptidase S8 [Actinomycetota bacterium]